MSSLESALNFLPRYREKRYDILKTLDGSGMFEHECAGYFNLRYETTPRSPAIVGFTAAIWI